MVNLILYGFEPSPPVRAALLTLNALGLEYEFKEVNMFARETHSKEFIEKNPQRTVPVLEDDGNILWESNAISAYLVKKYAKDDALYPKDYYQSALVDQRLHFNSGVLYPSLRNITSPLFMTKETNIPQAKIDAIYDGYNFLDVFLQNDFLAGNTLTVADLCAVSTVSSLDVMVPIDSAKTPKLFAWLNRLSKLPYYEKANDRGLAIFANLYKASLNES